MASSKNFGLRIMYRCFLEVLVALVGFFAGFVLLVWLPDLIPQVGPCLDMAVRLNNTWSCWVAVIFIELMLFLAIALLVWTPVAGALAVLSLAAVVGAVFIRAGHGWYSIVASQFLVVALVLYLRAFLCRELERFTVARHKWAVFGEQCRQLIFFLVSVLLASEVAKAKSSAVILWKCNVTESLPWFSNNLVWLMNSLGSFGRTLVWGDPEFVLLFVLVLGAVVVTALTIRWRPIRLTRWLVVPVFLALLGFWLFFSSPNPFNHQRHSPHSRAVLAALEIFCTLEEHPESRLLTSATKPTFWNTVYLSAAALLTALLFALFPRVAADVSPRPKDSG